MSEEKGAAPLPELVKPKEDTHDEETNLGRSGGQPVPGSQHRGGDSLGNTTGRNQPESVDTRAAERVNETIKSDGGETVSGDNSGTGGNVGAGVDSEVEKRGQKLPNRSASLRNTAPLPALLADANTVGKTEIAHGVAHVGIPVGKPKIAQQKQQVTKIDWYRYELDFRPLKTGFNVLIRKRLRWSDTRYSKMIVKRTCPRLTKKMVEQISVGRFPQTVVAALQDGGIQDGFIKALQERIGKGNGRRKSELTELERSLLARIESSLVAGGRSRSFGG